MLTVWTVRVRCGVYNVAIADFTVCSVKYAHCGLYGVECIMCPVWTVLCGVFDVDSVDCTRTVWSVYCGMCGVYNVNKPM